MRHVIDPATGDIMLDAVGNFERDGGPMPAMVFNMRVRRGSWWADKNKGHRLKDIKVLDEEAPIKAEDAAHEALDYLVDEGELVELSANARIVEPGDEVRIHNRRVTVQSAGIFLTVTGTDSNQREYTHEQFVRVGG